MIVDNEEDNFAFDKDISSSGADKIQLFIQCPDKTILLGQQSRVSGVRKAFP